MFQEAVNSKKDKVKCYELSNFDSFTDSGTYVKRNISVNFTLPVSVVDLRGKQLYQDYIIICTELGITANIYSTTSSNTQRVEFKKSYASVTFDSSGNATITKSCGLNILGSTSPQIRNLAVTDCKIRIYVFQ